jgi:hypothetical protein
VFCAEVLIFDRVSADGARVTLRKATALECEQAPEALRQRVLGVFFQILLRSGDKPS